MRRHLVMVMVGIVAGALLLAGAGTYLLAGHQLRTNDARVTLLQAREVAAELPLVEHLRSARLRDGILALLRNTDGLHLVVVGPAGHVSGTLPQGITAANLRPRVLGSGRAVAGVAGSLSYAAIPVAGLGNGPATGAGGAAVVLLVQRLPPTHLGLSYLLVVSGGALALAIAVAVVVSRRISRPLEEAVATTGRIARGDLTARVPDETGRFPELTSLTSSINAMAEALASARTGERQFLLSVSHDLRTPLTSILGYAEAIGDGAARDAGAAAGIIAAEARRLERLVGDLLELARLDSRQFSLHLATVDVAELVRVAAEGFRPSVEEAGLVLLVPIPPGGGAQAMVDPDRLGQVLGNLVENAYKYAASTVRVWAGLSGSDVAVTVDDDGPGIEPAEQSRVFDRFVQARRGPPPRHAGTGLGLAIVAELVAAMGGGLRVTSPTQPGGGTRMEVRLPAKVRPPAGARPTAEVRPPGEVRPPAEERVRHHPPAGS